MKTGNELIDEARGRIREVTPEVAMQLISQGALPLDLREPNEWNLGHLPEALHIPRGNLETTIEAIVPRVRQIVLYCASGNRSALAADTLRQMGYSDVCSLAGGIRAWADFGGDIED